MKEELIEYTLRSYPRFPRNWYYPKFRLATWHPVGVLTDAVADQIIEFVEMQEHDQDELFDRYTDFSGLTKIRLKVDHMFENRPPPSEGDGAGEFRLLRGSAGHFEHRQDV
jgi:hypothetical protein